MTTETQQQNDETTATDAAVEDTALAAAANAEGAATETDKSEADVADADKTADAEVVGAPEAYDITAFKMPEGVEFDSEGFEALEPALRDLDLSQEQAGKLVEAYTGKLVPLIQQRTAEAFDNQAAELRANLARDLQADPEVGGKKYEESKAMAAKAIAHFIPKADDRSDFSTFLNESGLGNHPLLMRVIAGSGRVLSEASTLAGNHGPQPLTEAQKFYGKRG